MFSDLSPCYFPKPKTLQNICRCKLFLLVTVIGGFQDFIVYTEGLTSLYFPPTDIHERGAVYEKCASVFRIDWLIQIHDAALI